ncbi:uncharacterized protein B0J16DRAFT_21060 [Fusarium flagelliforme]|uniref:uncharacterized protein n=1 Tax=Fusarium flagelliforme TaxID=2675880 RepID=UPI001E8EC01F|nr:uncharacterized protein B0J16DRAFT_21060 [Fusarium flagelliforme]KAH7197519.1 hypothetical protein B0J16DRAFT_21060 [Fusarium flagelliforme]
MDPSWLSDSDIQALRANFTSSGVSDDERFRRCWKHQTCKGCLATSQCSWCPFTWSCVPNTSKIPLLAPAYDENVCPHWAERWELRSRPLGCQVSSITSLTAIITIVSTLFFVLLVVLLVITARWIQRYHKNTGWWQRQNHRWDGARIQHGEHEPLLPGSRPDGGP